MDIDSFDTQISAILLMTVTKKQKLLTITANHDVFLRLDKGDSDSLRPLCIMLTFTDIKLIVE